MNELMKENNIKIIFDLSGSMNELGRRAVLRTYFAAIHKQYPDIQFWGWNKTVFPVLKVKDIVARDIVSGEALVKFLGQGKNGGVFLLVSDGIWEKGIAEDIFTAARKKMLSVQIGAYAKNLMLSEAAGNSKKVWEIEDLSMLLHHLLNGMEVDCD